MNLLLDNVVDPATTDDQAATSTVGRLFATTTSIVYRVELPSLQGHGGGSWRYITTQH